MVSLQELKQKIKDVDKQLTDGRKNKSISLKKADDLWVGIEENNKDFPKDALELQTLEDIVWVFIKFIWVNNDFVRKWQKEKSHPTEEEFNIIRKYSGKFQNWVDEIREKFPSFIKDSLYQDLKEEIKEIEDFVPQEENYRKSPSDNHIPNNNDDSTNNNDNSNDQGKGGGNQPSFSDNSDFDRKIKDLQTRIKELEKKQEQNPNSNNNQQTERELSKAERELERLREEQNNKKPGKQNLQNGKNKGDFPTGLVVGGGIVILLLLIAVIFFWQRSRKK